MKLFPITEGGKEAARWQVRRSGEKNQYVSVSITSQADRGEAGERLAKVEPAAQLVGHRLSSKAEKKTGFRFSTWNILKDSFSCGERRVINN